MDPTLQPHSFVPADALSSFMSVYFVGVALFVGAVVEGIKRTAFAIRPDMRKSHAFSGAMASVPLALGAVVGWAVIPPGELPGFIVGAIAGSTSASVYAMLKPVRMLGGKGAKTEE